ncbi:hypothetical protein KEM48_000858 [Puccinia striiformis f. sp. tritici PST-130]|nr:hypothetical protein KEM48_000858 [Puccinia striiformis f. sp. tritici PST-130]
MRSYHSDIRMITSLTYNEQITYYRARLAVCANVTSIRPINSFLLRQLPGVVTKLVCFNLAEPHPSTACSRPEDSRETLRPDTVIKLKRGMVLSLLDNEGHEGYLKTWDRLLLVAICTNSLIVKPLGGEKEGLNLVLRRLRYRSGTARRGEHGTVTQFPVMAGFAMLGANAYYDPLLTRRMDIIMDGLGVAAGDYGRKGHYQITVKRRVDLAFEGAVLGHVMHQSIILLCCPVYVSCCAERKTTQRGEMPEVLRVVLDLISRPLLDQYSRPWNSNMQRPEIRRSKRHDTMINLNVFIRVGSVQ